MNTTQVIARLNKLANPDKIALKAKKFGINANNSLGVYHKDLKVIAKEIGKNDKLALALYDTGIYEAKLLCSKIFTPEHITIDLMNAWVSDFENWEICDSFCMGFFVRSDFALEKAMEWSESNEEFVKRASFVIMAAYGFAHKDTGNSLFESFFPVIERETHDGRIYVKKAVNWALRNIGKRNTDLHQQAIAVANRILASDTKSGQWIAKDALKELTKPGLNVLDYPRHIYRP